MFYSLHATWQFIFLFLGLAGLVFVSWRWPRWGAWLVIFLTPLYLLKIGNWPLTALEALIWVFVGIWIVKKYCCHPGLACPAPDQVEGMLFAGMTKEKFAAIIKNRLFWPILLILAGVILSVLFSRDITVGLGILKSWFLAPIIFAFVLSDILKQEHGLGGIFLALFASSFVVAAISFAYLMLGQLTFDSRLAAFYLSPNHLAMFLTPGLIAGLSLWFEAKNNWQKFLLFIVYCLLFVVIYFIHSCGAWFGLAAAVVFISFYFWKYKIINGSQLFLVSCFLFFVFASVFFLQLNGGNNEKLTNLLTSPRSSWQSRLMVWQSALKILKDHWLLGIGPGLFQKYYLEYQKYFPVPYLEWAVPQPHNLFLAWWLQAGFLGFFGFIWLVWRFFRLAFGALVKIKPSFVPLGKTTEGRQPLIIILMAVMVYFLVHGLVDTTFWKNDLALIFWVVIFLGCRAGRRVC